MGAAPLPGTGSVILPPHWSWFVTPTERSGGLKQVEALAAEIREKQIPGLPKLTWLDLSGCTGLTEETVSVLKAALPECRITGPRDRAFMPNTPAKVRPR